MTAAGDLGLADEHAVAAGRVARVQAGEVGGPGEKTKSLINVGVFATIRVWLQQYYAGFRSRQMRMNLEYKILLLMRLQCIINIYKTFLCPKYEALAFESS